MLYTLNFVNICEKNKDKRLQQLSWIRVYLHAWKIRKCCVATKPQNLYIKKDVCEKYYLKDYSIKNKNYSNVMKVYLN